MYTWLAAIFSDGRGPRLAICLLINLLPQINFLLLAAIDETLSNIPSFSNSRLLSHPHGG
jgi:hypothetical protein